MSDILQLTKENIQTKSVDLDDLQALIQYLAVGLTFQNGFQILKHAVKSNITKAQATRLRNEFLSLVGGKPKSYLRARLPLFMIGIVQYGTQAVLNEPIINRINAFKSLLRRFDEGSLNTDTLETIKATCSQGLSLPYYTSKLNNTLDPVSSFFDGRTPNSFSNSLAEFARLIDQRLQASTPNRDRDTQPTVRVVEEPERTVTVVEEPERELRLLPEAPEDGASELPPTTPNIELVDTYKEPSTQPASSVLAENQKSAEEDEFLRKYKPWLIGGACAVALTSVVLLARR